MKKLILSVLGRDRPGIIAAVSGTLYENDCNIENVSQTIVQTQFSGTFIVSIPETLSVEVLKERLQSGLNLLDLDVFIQRIDPSAAGPAVTHAEPFVITTRGPDQKGLVARITAVIARHGVNVTNLQAIFKGGADPDNNIMIYEVDIPRDSDRRELQRDLQKKAEELNLEISIQHRNIFEAINRI